MDRLVLGRIASPSTWSLARSRRGAAVGLRCASRDDNNAKNNNTGGRGDQSSTDWEKAWASYRKKGRKGPLSKFSPGKYLRWNPRRSEYPLSEEVDPIKRTERSNLSAWIGPTFTLGGAIVIITLLLVYTRSAPLKWLYLVCLQKLLEKIGNVDPNSALYYACCMSPFCKISALYVQESSGCYVWLF